MQGKRGREGREDVDGKGNMPTAAACCRHAHVTAVVACVQVTPSTDPNSPPTCASNGAGYGTVEVRMQLPPLVRLYGVSCAAACTRITSVRVQMPFFFMRTVV